MGLANLLAPRVAELGKIKIGTLGDERKSKRGGTYRVPVKLDRFLITHCERDAAGRLAIDESLMRSLVETYGVADGEGGKRKLRQIPIYLLSDEIEEVLRARWVRYDGRRCLETCNGREHEVRFDGNGEKMANPVVRPCLGRPEDHPRESGWKLHGDLACVIAHGEARFGGVYRFRTTSVISLSQLYGGLLHIQSLTGGVLAGIPMRLVVRGQLVEPQGRPTTVYVVHIEVHASDLGEVQRQALAAATYRAQHHREIREAQRQYAALLAAPGDEDEDEVDALVQEYHPEQHAVDPLAALRTDPPEPYDPETGEVYDDSDREPGEEG